MHYKLIKMSVFRFCDLVYIYDILTHFDYDTARNLVLSLIHAAMILIIGT